MDADHGAQHSGEGSDELPTEQLGDDRDLSELDDLRDREELRNRYYGLLQELRVVLPGAQVLVAFLVTAPFATRFPELDDMGLGIFGVATVCSMLAVICMLSPAAFHRFGRRTARAQRLRWSIRLTVVGMGFLGVAMVATLLCVVRFVYGTIPSLLIVIPVAVALPLFWIVLPLTVGSRPSDEIDEPDGDERSGERVSGRP
ncbi:MAG: DUF6328 family protein [Actinomycetota bacterium]|nr:DUF6328 family protein [Actinomycetota bacterium]